METESVIVNPDEELDVLMQELQDTTDLDEPQVSPNTMEEILEQLPEEQNDEIGTIHSTDTCDPGTGIPIIQESIDAKSNQFHINEVFNTDLKITIKKRKHQTIHTVQLPKHQQEMHIINLIKEYMAANKTYFVYCTPDIYKQLCRTYTTHFSNNGPKIIRCTEKALVIEDTEEQLRVIKNYHEGITNHRGINETLKQIQQKYFWPEMKATITTYINNCENCKRCKYERHPPKTPLMITETYARPFQRIY